MPQVKKKTEKTSHLLNEEDITDLYGRREETLEILAAIKRGEFQDLEALRKHLSVLAKRLEATITAAKAGEKITFLNGCFMELRPAKRGREKV